MVKIYSDPAVFQFHSEYYEKREVEEFSRSQCEKLCVIDEDNVTKFTESVQYLLNENLLDIDNCYFKIFF